MYSAQRKRRNGENNRTLTLTLFLTGPKPNPKQLDVKKRFLLVHFFYFRIKNAFSTFLKKFSQRCY